MAKKLFAVFLLSMIVLAAVHFDNAQADDDDNDYKDCFKACDDRCFQDGKGEGYTFCEMKCDSECGAKAIKDKLNSLVH